MLYDTGLISYCRCLSTCRCVILFHETGPTTNAPQRIHHVSLFIRCLVYLSCHISGFCHWLQDVFRGESLILQIQVNGSDSPAEPDLSGLIHFQVENLGGQTQNSESISIKPGCFNSTGNP